MSQQHARLGLQKSIVCKLAILSSFLFLMVAIFSVRSHSAKVQSDLKEKK